MAIIETYIDFNQSNLDLNLQNRLFSSENVLDNVFFAVPAGNFDRTFLGVDFKYSYAGETIEDFYSVEYDNSNFRTIVGGNALTYTGNGAPTSGTITFLGSYYEFGGDFITAFAVYDITISAAEFRAAVASASTVDDQALINAALAGDDHFILGSGDDVAFGRGGNDLMFGHMGNDRLSGNGGRDKIIGGEGNDVLNGGGGRDFLVGEAGDDSLNGGRGVDTALFFDPAGDGDYTVDLSLRGAQDTGQGLDSLRGIENLFTGSGSDALRGNTAANFLKSGGGNDILIGRGGNDRLMGEAGNDLLNGGRGMDFLSGGGGRDRLIGAQGDDVLRGGAGRDVFVFSGNSGNDLISDFADGKDQIEITSGAVDFIGLGIAQLGTSVVISFASSTLTVENALVSDFNAADFIF